MTITDEMVERGAEALINQMRADHGLPPLKIYDHGVAQDRKYWLKRSRAVIEAALSGKEVEMIPRRAKSSADGPWTAVKSSDGTWSVIVDDGSGAVIAYRLLSEICAKSIAAIPDMMSEITDLKDNVATKARHIGEQAAEIDRLRAILA